MKYLKRLGYLLLALILLLIATGIFYYQYKKPNYDNKITVKSITHDTEVLYDEHGIPHIYAQNETDAYFTLGYCHAKDRLFQMEILRRLANGRLCEILGNVPAALDADKYFRTMSIRKQAEKTVAELYQNPDDPVVKAGKAYVAGINFFQETGTTPIEFDILGIPKVPFDFTDCFVVAGYMGLSFCQAFDSEPINSYILAKFGESRVLDLVQHWDSAAVCIPVAPDPRELLKLSEGMGKIRDFMNIVPPFHGSNSWVLAGSRTQSGRPILENDTHIAFSQPSVWYEAHLEYPGQSIYGNFIAGAPVPVLGHTNAGAWGITMFENDDVDFYRETVNPENPNQVKFKDGWENIETRDEIIKIKGEADYVLKVRRSRHGYFLNEAFKMFKNEEQPISMWWIFNQETDQSLRAFYNLSKAKNVQDAQAAAALFHAPGLNIMWADSSGGIGWWAAGRIPVRPAHVQPFLILDGASGKDEIEGWLPFSANPQNVNPTSGFVFSANNQPATAFGQAQVLGYYCPEDRARRFVEMFEMDKKYTPEDVQRIAFDNVNPNYPEVLLSVLPVLEKTASTETEKSALEILKKWEGSHGLEDVAPTVFYRWLYHFYIETFHDEIPSADAMKHFLKSHTLKRSLTVLVRNDKSEWWDDVRTADRRETRNEIFEKAFHMAVSDLEKQLGASPANWQWKRVHSITHNHPLGVLPVAGKYFSVGPFPVPGGKETINNLDFALDSTGVYRVLYGPALRRVLDFSQRENSMSINPTGQSGNVGSPFYKDQAEMFVRGEFRHEWTRRADIEKVKTAVLRLTADRGR